MIYSCVVRLHCTSPEHGPRGGMHSPPSSSARYSPPTLALKVPSPAPLPDAKSPSPAPCRRRMPSRVRVQQGDGRPPPPPCWGLLV
eukprot:scaffold494_cov117-Isochrysis_galbana.AAC.7